MNKRVEATVLRDGYGAELPLDVLVDALYRFMESGRAWVFRDFDMFKSPIGVVVDFEVVGGEVVCRMDIDHEMTYLEGVPLEAALGFRAVDWEAGGEFFEIDLFMTVLGYGGMAEPANG